MKKISITAVLGVLASAALSFVLIHFFLAKWVADLLAISYGFAYAFLVTLLALLTIWRTIRTALGLDSVSRFLDRQFKD